MPPIFQRCCYADIRVFSPLNTAATPAARRSLLRCRHSYGRFHAAFTLLLLLMPPLTAICHAMLPAARRAATAMSDATIFF